MKFNETQIRHNIIDCAMNKKKTIEGVYYYNKSDNSYLFAVGVLNVAHLISDNDNMKDIKYFKCTKSGNLKTYIMKF